jgi:hypothetical protein
MDPGSEQKSFITDGAGASVDADGGTLVDAGGLVDVGVLLGGGISVAVVVGAVAPASFRVALRSSLHATRRMKSPVATGTNVPAWRMASARFIAYSKRTPSSHARKGL